ncbi:MAG: SxtJ family membrane protein [Candidatus Omnitrophota bacterium]
MKIIKKQVLVFGYGLSLILAFVGYRLWVKHGDLLIPLALGVVALMLLCMSILKWETLIPLYQKWMAVVHVIGAVVTSVILSVVFFVLFGIAGLAMRILKKDPLDQKLEPQKESYWHLRKQEDFNQQRYHQQF